MRAQQPARIARVKKLSRSQGQQILREDEIDSDEYDSLHNQSNKVTSGVEAAEESEVHLQAALAAASTGEKEGEIPAPPADESADIDYDALYPLVFTKPTSYIRFSQTVEESTGCQYDMTTEDDVFLKEYNKKKTGGKCSEDAFEKIMAVFEETATIHTPYASVDNTIVPFETMKTALVQQLDDKLQSFAKDFYDHWIARQQLQPTLKYETHQDNDDGDPYVCFRYREVRQTRKTRARDNVSADRLKKLRREMEEAKGLVMATHQRELMKRDLIKCDKQIFKQRATLKDTKVKLSIKTNDDDLINQKPQKKHRPSDFPVQRPPVQGRLPGRVDGRSLDADLVHLSDLQEEKENDLRRKIDEKALMHRKWNDDHVDLTREPLSPIQGHGPETSFRPATAQYQYLTPPSSVTSESLEQSFPVSEKPEPAVARYSSPPQEDEPRGQPAYRRRVGRLGRLWIDRRGMVPSPRIDDETMSDRWKYDQDDDDEQPVYELDPYDIDALRYRSTIPFRSRQDEKAAALLARASGASPSNNRAIASGQQPAPT